MKKLLIWILIFQKKGNNLNNVVVTFKGDKTTAIGIMNRNAGITEENIEYMINGSKYVIEDLVDFFKVSNKGKIKKTSKIRFFQSGIPYHFCICYRVGHIWIYPGVWFSNETGSM